MFTSTGVSSDAYFDYAGVTNANVTDPFPTNINLGTFRATGAAGLVNDTFVLTVMQTVPTADSDTLTSASFAGSISATSSNVSLSFAGDGPEINYEGTNYITFMIDDETYGLQEFTQLSPSSTAGGTTTLGGLLISTPEPSAWVLAGTGMLGILGGALRRRKQVVQVAK
jgi:MYXO-CTERM domain-containing protein